jgi:hypothetical protein
MRLRSKVIRPHSAASKVQSENLFRHIVPWFRESRRWSQYPVYVIAAFLGAYFIWYMIALVDLGWPYEDNIQSVASFPYRSYARIPVGTPPVRVRGRL